MRVKRHNYEHRVRRMRLRASADRPPLRLEAPEPHLVPTAAKASAIADEPDGNRRFRRLPLDRQILVRKAGGFNFELAVLDVSTAGCGVELVEMVEVGERVVARLPGLEPLGAHVAWVDGHKAGLSFDRPLHRAVFDRLIDRHAPCAA